MDPGTRFFVAPVGVIHTFVPGIVVSLISDQVKVFDYFETLSMQNRQNVRGSLLHCAPEENHD
ncbi:MAG: hypothetical protein CMQ84_05145 [Gammaproteobacteria bacterium]|nr:hypothetical protein [Gammaproteobacteria bacterium]OUX77959.1 MAG: hypothetical protein CBC19_05840 [Oceanospirillales bacterium TMED59]